MKKILTMSVREMYAMILIVLMLLFSLVYTSMALFEKTVEKVGIASIIASEIDFTLTSDESGFIVNGNSGTITVPAGETKMFNINISNIMSNSVRYKTYYRFENDITILGVNVGISNNSKSLDTDLIGVGSSKTVRIIIQNNATQSATIEIGVQGGYATNTAIALNTGRNKLDSIEEPKENPCGTEKESSLVCKILGNDYENVTTTESTFSSTSTDRGLYVQEGNATKSINGLSTYYFRGSTTNETINPNYVMNNYVKFGTYQTEDGENTVGNDIVWRVVRINEDGTIRLISENKISSISLNDSGLQGRYINEDGTDSEAKTTVETWYENNIGNNSILDSKVVESSFCNDISGIDYTENSYGNAYNRLQTNTPQPTFICLEGAIKVTEKVGMLTLDELVYAGGYIEEVQNNITYLNNNYFFTLMTPASNYTYAWNYTNKQYSPSTNGEGTYYSRAVINLKSDVTISGGDGLSADTAYMINLE